jgi:hypothetical protein
MGVVMESPLKKSNILNATPNNALTASCNMSRQSVIRFLINSEWKIKMHTAATETLINMNAKG